MSQSEELEEKYPTECDICDCILTSLKEARIHREGKEHKNKMKIQKLEKDGETLPLYCPKCDVHLSGKIPAYDHFHSKMHNLIAELVTCIMTPIPEIKYAMKIINKEKKTLFFCNLCRKPMDTSIILESHMESKAHKDKEELKSSEKSGIDIPENENENENSGSKEEDPSESLMTHNYSTGEREHELMTGSEDHNQHCQSLDQQDDSLTIIKGLINPTSNDETLISSVDVRDASPPPGTGGETEYQKNNPDNDLDLEAPSGDDTKDILRKPRKKKQRDNVRRINMGEGAYEVHIPVDNEEVPSFARNIEVEEISPDGKSDPDCIPSLETPSPFGSQEEGHGQASPHVCEICHVSVNSESTYDAHIKGQVHLKNVAHSKAEQINLATLKKTVDFSQKELFDKGFNISKTCPRSYQIELMAKAMAQDSVIFLPTGTGKTLVAVLLMGLMLEENFNRPVIFLVDKVLLVLQHGPYIKKELELESKKFFRHVLDNHQIKKERSLNVACVCGDVLNCEMMPLSKHDIIITTADYCINLLKDGIILWEHFSLAVLDEVHHCTKNHPYRRLLSVYHEGIADPVNRPKIIGLTASPAGKDTVEATLDMLKQLLKMLGGAQLVTISDEDEDCIGMKRFQSNSKLQSICVPLTSVEEDFQLDCFRYCLRCCVKLATLSSCLNLDCFPSLKQLKNEFSEEHMNTIATNLLRDPEPLSDVMDSISQIQEESQPFELLKKHVLKFFLYSSLIPSGLDFQELENIFDSEGENHATLENVQKQGIPCDDMKFFIAQFKEKGSRSPLLDKLLKILQDSQYINWDSDNSMVLVLVRQRKEAEIMARTLNQIDFVQKRNLCVTLLVGHGKGADNKGMSLKKQKPILESYRSFHILVATSIAEEGIDISHLKLVISMNPPPTVKALVQMRGRARQKDGHFIIICNSITEKERVDKLIKQEDNMMEAAKICIASQQH